MRPRSYIIVLLLSVLCPLSTCEEVVPLATALRNALLPVLKNISRAYDDTAWSVAYKDANVTLEVCAGFADNESKIPCNASTDKYAFGSTTKSQTAVLVLDLVEQGRLNLDDLFVDRADTFVRRISNTSLPALFPGPQLQKLTIRHLLQMQSGIKDYDGRSVREFQNTHRGTDLGPIWVLENADRTFYCEPGTCGIYSSTNYVMLGLVVAQEMGLGDWDQLDQTAWTHGRSDFKETYYGVHGPCINFTDAQKRRSGVVSGYQPVCDSPFHPGRGDCVDFANQSNILHMSCTQGWTCGNLATTVSQVAAFFWQLLSPASGHRILNATTLAHMLAFEKCSYFRHPKGKLNCAKTGDNSSRVWGYGLGLMNL